MPDVFVTKHGDGISLWATAAPFVTEILPPCANTLCRYVSDHSWRFKPLGSVLPVKRKQQNAING